MNYLKLSLGFVWTRQIWVFTALAMMFASTAMTEPQQSYFQPGNPALGEVLATGDEPLAALAAPPMPAIPSSTYAPLSGPVFLPIIMYHHMPADFDYQLTYLEERGYTSISLDQALAGLAGEPLPEKPVVITFDDGYFGNLEAYEILRRHQVKATFYVLPGGEASQWCIGAERRYGDPLQPSEGCGDTYVNWDQIRQLDKDNLITIGGHTFNHRDLTTLSEAEKRFEITASKQAIERELGHPIYHFAYPYGAFDEASVRIVQESGYSTAVTTMPGTMQEPGTQLTWRRVRDVYSLP